MRFYLFAIVYKIAAICLWVTFWSAPIFPWIVVLSILIYGGFIALFVTFHRFNAFVKGIKPFKEGIILSFDDGPNPLTTPIVLDVLKKHKIQAMFCLIGKKVDAHPTIVKRIFDEGHFLINHSYSHKNALPYHPKKKLKSDFLKCQQSIERITDKKPLVFRPPFGVTSPPYYYLQHKTKWQALFWDIRSFDTKIKEINTLQESLLTTLETKQNGVLLLHDNHCATANALDVVITQAKQSGTTFADAQKLNLSWYDEN